MERKRNLDNIWNGEERRSNTVSQNLKSLLLSRTENAARKYYGTAYRRINTELEKQNS
jgi:hypothetical protein